MRKLPITHNKNENQEIKEEIGCLKCVDNFLQFVINHASSFFTVIGEALQIISPATGPAAPIVSVLAQPTAAVAGEIVKEGAEVADKEVTEEASQAPLVTINIPPRPSNTSTHVNDAIGRSGDGDAGIFEPVFPNTAGNHAFIGHSEI